MLYDLQNLLSDNSLPYNPFEAFCLSLLKKIFPTGELQLTDKSNDGGIDIKGTININDKILCPKKLYCQCKLYNLARSIGVDTIRSFNGATCNDFSEKIFITTGYFSEDAILFAKNQHIKLIDGLALCDLMREYDLFLTHKLNISEIKISLNLK